MIRCDRCGAEPADHRDVPDNVEDNHTVQADLCDKCCEDFTAMVKVWCQPLLKVAP